MEDIFFYKLFNFFSLQPDYEEIAKNIETINDFRGSSIDLASRYIGECTRNIQKSRELFLEDLQNHQEKFAQFFEEEFGCNYTETGIKDARSKIINEKIKHPVAKLILTKISIYNMVRGFIFRTVNQNAEKNFKISNTKRTRTKSTRYALTLNLKI